MSRWKVTKAFGVWYAIEHGWKHYKSFPAWAKAMSYADRKSRQPLGITIKDPSGTVSDLTARVNPHNHIYLKTGVDTFTLAPHEWEPLAEFLLDAAKNGDEE